MAALTAVLIRASAARRRRRSNNSQSAQHVRIWSDLQLTHAAILEVYKILKELGLLGGIKT